VNVSRRGQIKTSKTLKTSKRKYKDNKRKSSFTLFILRKEIYSAAGSKKQEIKAPLVANNIKNTIQDIHTSN